MTPVGIEAMNLFAGTVVMDVAKLAEHRNLDTTRFDNLLMKEKSVALPYEDPITFAVNAAKPIIDSLTEQQRDSIEMVITCTESAFDFGKSMSTYCHELLNLNRNCRLFELKNACYSGVAGLQMAINFVRSQASPGARVLVIATDLARFMIEAGGDALSADWSFAEPSAGAGAMAMLVSEQPEVFQIDFGANGYYGYQVMDSCRPSPDADAGDIDLSLLSYLDCCEQAFKQYCKRVNGVDLSTSFSYIAYHTPFGGMVKGAHRNLMRKILKAKPQEIEQDFEARVLPGMAYCQRVGNIMGATTMLSLASTIEHGNFDEAKRVGVFSYGSGCCSEFFSGVISREGQQKLKKMKIKEQLDRRYQLSTAEYDAIIEASTSMKFGIKNLTLDSSFIPQARKVHDHPVLFLSEIKDYARSYDWV